jgi:hypothetical protein
MWILVAFGGSKDAFEAAQTDVVGGGQSSGSRSRTVGVDDGKALRLVESIGQTPRLLVGWPALRSLVHRSLLETKVQVNACAECE